MFLCRYSPKNCQFECLLQELRSLHNCLPWDVPGSFVEGETVLCSGQVALQFKRALNTNMSEACWKKCGLPLCNGVTYVTKVAFHATYFFIVYGS